MCGSFRQTQVQIGEIGFAKKNYEQSFFNAIKPGRVLLGHQKLLLSNLIFSFIYRENLWIIPNQYFRKRSSKNHLQMAVD